MVTGWTDGDRESGARRFLIPRCTTGNCGGRRARAASGWREREFGKTNEVTGGPAGEGGKRLERKGVWEGERGDGRAGGRGR